MKMITFILMLLLYRSASAQSTGVKGRVIDEDRVPVMGATVTGNRNTVITKTDGSFLLTQVQAGDTVVITAAGFESLHTVFTNQSDLVLILQRSVGLLEEVVMETGYQQIPKERSTGSFASISKKQFNEQVSADVLTRLEAIGSGLTVDRITGEQPKMQVRGISTIQGPRDPLIIVDNFPYEGNINNINPNEVASITILKDAAASSIWGARAGNGVIVITTTKSKYNKPLSVQFNQYINITQAPDLFRMKLMSPAAHVDVEQYLFNLDFRVGDTAIISRPPLTPVYEILLNQRYGRITTVETDRQLNYLRGQDLRHDFNRYFYQPAIAQQYYLSINAGTDRAAAKLAIGYDRSETELASHNDRINIKLDNQFRLNDRLQFSTGIYLTRIKSSSGKPGYGQLTTATGLLPLYAKLADANGNALPVMKDYRMPWLDTIGGGRLLNWNYYPLHDYRFAKTNQTSFDLLLNSMMEYKLSPWLSANVNYQYEKQDLKEKNFYDQQSYYVRNLVNLFTQLGNSSAGDKFIIPRGSILDHSQSVLNVHQVRGQLNMHKNWARHKLNMIGGAELRHAFNEMDNNRLYGFNPDILSITPVDYANAYPNFLTGSQTFIPDNVSLNDSRSRFVSLYANGAYTYRSRYTFSFSARKDASNLLGVLTNEKWNPLWSAGLSWKLSEETFAPLKQWLNYQFRLTYGVSGNVDLSRTGVTIIGYTLNSPYTQTPQASISRYANPELQWEQSYMFNTGVDFALVNNRLSGSVEYYYKRGDRLFGNTPIDYTGGAGTTINKNVASMKGHGIDVVLDALLLKRTFTWNMQLLYSRYKDRVTDYYLSSLEGRNFIAIGRPRISGLEGKPVYSMYSYQWAGLDGTNGNPQGIMDGALSTDYTRLTRDPMINDLVYHGPALPVHYGSLGNTIGFKNFEITARLIYKLGYYYRRRSIDYNSLFELKEGHQDYHLRWQKPGDELHTNVPSMIYPVPANRELFYGGSSVLVEKGDHLRLAYINFGYNLASETLRRGTVKNLRIYGTISNLGILWRANHSGTDPDNPSALLPPSRSFAIGINATL